MLSLSPCTVVAAHPHDPQAFTQGLCWVDDALFESTGLTGCSTVRRVRLEDGAVLQSSRVPDDLFGEGLTAWGDELLSLTYQGGRGFRWDRRTLALRGEFAFDGEGWGLTNDGTRLIMSNGTPRLSYLDPVTLAPACSLVVTAGGRPLPWINELQYVAGEIWANVLTLPAIARIDPVTGVVRGWIDLGPIVAEAAAGDREKVANGIAHDPQSGRLFVTGKNWSRLYEIQLG
nr:glutaminyl-peptide cyclotransferase [Sphingomonas deserti]